MTYVSGSPEVVFGDWIERTTIERCIRDGWHVLHTSQVGEGATMIEGPDGKEVMPDLQLIDLIRHRNSRLVQVKGKRGAYPYKKLQIDCTGMDWPCWDSCRRINDSGVPVDVAMIHMRWPLRHSREIAPKLLWQTVSRLDEHGGPMRWTNPQAPNGMAVWDVKTFDLLGDLPSPPAGIVEALHSINLNLRVWERPPQLRKPRLVPGQLELSLVQSDERLVYTGKLVRGGRDGEVKGWLYNHHTGDRIEFGGSHDPRGGGYLIIGRRVPKVEEAMQ